MKPAGTIALYLSLLLVVPPPSSLSGQTDALRVQVSLVTVGVRVTNKAGREVSGLRAEDFRILEDGVRQPIAFFSSEEQALSFGILLDRSQSMGEAEKLSRAKAAAQVLVRCGHADNELFLLPFDHTVPDPPEFTADRDRVMQEIRATSAGGGTSLYDAMVGGLERAATAMHRRQVLVVITDGADQHSRHTLDQVIHRLRRSQVQMYLIGYFAPEEDEAFRLGGPTVSLIDGTPIDNPRVVFERLAAESGAEAFFPTSQEALQRIAEAISIDLRTQYTLAYYPPNPSQLDRYRRIRVEVRRKGVNVRARRGYILRADAGAASAEQDAAPKDMLPGGNRPNVPQAKSESHAKAVSRCEDFSDSSSGWPVRADAFYSGRSYCLKGKDVLVTNRPQMSDFRARLRLQVKSDRLLVEQSALPGRMTGAGLVFRAGSEGFYAVIVYFHPKTGRGYCVAIRQDGNRVAELARWPATVLLDRPVDLGVVATGNKVEAFLSRRLVGTFEDRRFVSGVFGLVLAGSGEARFSDFCIEPIFSDVRSESPAHARAP